MPNGFILTWDHPSVRPGPYDIMVEHAASECAYLAGQTQKELVRSGIYTNTFTVNFAPSDRVICFYPRLAGCETFRSFNCFGTWNFFFKPPKPNLISAVASGPAQVTVAYSYPDERVGLFLQRAGADGVFGQPGAQGAVDYCPANSPQSVTDYGPGGSPEVGGKLAPGTYFYRLFAFTQGGGATFSDTLSVTVGSGCVLPKLPQISAPKTNVTVDEPVTVNWTTTENPDRFRIEVSRDPNFATAVRSGIAAGTARTATIRFFEAGQIFARVVAVNACGERAGNSISFNVSPHPARVVATAKPSGMLQVIGEAAATDSYTLHNLGGTATNIHLNQEGNFFTQAPTDFTLNPGASRVISISAQQQPAVATLTGLSIPTGAGVPSGLQMPIRLIANTRPAGDPVATVPTGPINLVGAEGDSPTGSIQISNLSPPSMGSIKGVLVSNVPWLIPIDEFVNLPLGQTGTFRFRIDRALRARTRGSEVGTLQLFYMRAAESKSSSSHRPAGSAPPPGSKATVVTISDTVKPPVTAGAIPVIAADEIAYFVPGVGRVQGGTGFFISDVTILNSGGIEDLDDLKVYYVPNTGTASNAQLASFSQIAANQSINLVDVTKSVFSLENALGSLQVRTKRSSSISINANVLNISDPAGTFGTSLPVLNSDRSLGPQEKIHLTGLRKDATVHTNIYVQETAGQTATAQLEFLSSAGAVLRTDANFTVPPFGMVFVSGADDQLVPPGSVAVVITNLSGNGARVTAHATPNDRASRDFWSVVDWPRHFGYSPTETVVIPVVGKAPGAGSSYFRTDIAVMNIGTSTASGTLRYYPSGGQPIDHLLTLGSRESRILPDAVTSTFGITAPSSLGHIQFIPSGGSFVVTSRIFTLDGDKSYGTGVPTLALGAALQTGDVRKFSGMEDSSTSTVVAKTPGTYRTNLGLVELTGQPAKVRATIRYTAVQGAAAAVGVGSFDIDLQPRQLLLPSSSLFILGEATRALFGDLRDVQIDYEVISGPGEVMVFTSTLDNGTNDTALRVDED